jgi:hypothetical protein
MTPSERAYTPDVMAEARRRAILANQRDTAQRMAPYRGMLPDVPWEHILTTEELRS